MAGFDGAQELLDRLRAGGLRITAARRALVEALVAAGDAGHATADDLADAVHRTHPDLHRSTVYRTLDALEQAGVVVHVHLGHGSAVYHLAEDRHLHLVCDACGDVVEVPESVLGPLRRRLATGFGFRLDAGHFALPGRCAACAT